MVTQLTHAEWCLMAASDDEARPVITALNITPTELLATDGHRLHLVGRNGHDDGLSVGLWSKTPGRQVDGKFPKWEQAFAPLTGSTRVLDVLGALPVIEAAIAFGAASAVRFGSVTIPTTDGSDMAVRCNAQYLKDILAGRKSELVRYQAPGPHTSMTWFLDGLTRVAALMPIREPLNEGIRDSRFDLSEFVTDDGSA